MIILPAAHRHNVNATVVVGTPVTRRRRVEDVVTQGPPPQIVACGFPARRASERGAQLGIRLKAHIGDGQLRPYQGKAFAGILASAVATGDVLSGSGSSMPSLTA